MHCSGPNASPDPRWALICCFNARSNTIDPIPVRPSRPLATLLSPFLWPPACVAVSLVPFVLPWVCQPVDLGGGAEGSRRRWLRSGTMTACCGSGGSSSWPRASPGSDASSACQQPPARPDDAHNLDAPTARNEIEIYTLHSPAVTPRWWSPAPLRRRRQPRQPPSPPAAALCLRACSSVSNAAERACSVASCFCSAAICFLRRTQPSG